MKSQVKFQREWFPHRREEPPRREKPQRREILHTATLDAPALAAAMKSLGWTYADLAREARLREDHVRALISGKVFNSQSVRAVQLAVNEALVACRVQRG